MCKNQTGEVGSRGGGVLRSIQRHLEKKQPPTRGRRTPPVFHVKFRWRDALPPLEPRNTAQSLPDWGPMSTAFEKKAAKKYIFPPLWVYRVTRAVVSTLLEDAGKDGRVSLSLLMRTTSNYLI